MKAIYVVFLFFIIISAAFVAADDDDDDSDDSDEGGRRVYVKPVVIHQRPVYVKPANVPMTRIKFKTKVSHKWHVKAKQKSQASYRFAKRY